MFQNSSLLRRALLAEAQASRARGLLREQGDCLLAPLLGLPAISVPTGLADGLPMGVQLIGARFREDLLLDAAAAIESRCAPMTPIDPRP